MSPKLKPHELIPFEKEAVKAYLDRNIVFWRKQLDAGNVVADDYIDAYQSVRMTLFGELLPLEGGITMRAADLACTCAKVRFYPDENVFAEDCPIHGTPSR
jgi:hypothetical protein